MQKRSSMNTSVNTSRLPSIWGKLDYDWMRIHLIQNIVDYGCGRKATQDKVYLNLRCRLPTTHAYFPYDPYWGDADRNEMTLRCLTVYQEADLCICANVLNVIDDDEELEKIIKEVTQAKYWAFQIYEGDKSGIGKESKVGCWQRNAKTDFYVKFILEHSPACGIYIVKNNIITNYLSLIK